MKTKILITIIIVIFSIGLYAATYTVNPSTPNIQTVINSASTGDIIEFEDGTYTLSTFITVSNGISLISKNGANACIIDGGYTIPGTGVRCFHLSHADAVVDGFTIQNAFGNFTDKHGGGLRLANGATVQNCIIKNNQSIDGGGIAIDASGGYVLNCIIKDNEAVWGGGIRLFGGEVRNCLITGNSAIGHGGGVNIYTAGNLYNCTITNNESPDGGGVRLWNVSNVGNNIIYNNTPTNLISTGGGNNIFNNYTSDPQFVGANDFHLQLGSAAIDAGLNDSWMTTSFDLDGNNRIYNATVDIGCYEYNVPIPTTFVPDDNFEQALIDLGYDVGPLDDYVPTANISSITTLNINAIQVSGFSYTRIIQNLTGIEDFTSLEELICNHNGITNLDLSDNTALTDLECSYSSIQSINLSNNTALVNLICSQNQLSSLDLSHNIALQILECGFNSLSSLDLSHNTALEEFSSTFNPITSLDLSNNNALIRLYCYNDLLESLNVKNGNNSNFTLFDARNNPNLICIEVDNATWSTANWTNIDPTASFSEDCSTAPINDADGDGVADVDDDFPNDPEKAFLNKFPASGYGSLGFEDLWPGRGDYDFNDLVVDYKFRTISNAQNKIVFIRAKFIVKASGAYFHNGFGFNLPFANTALNNDLTVRGYDLQESYIDLKSNGLEDSQSHPTVIVFDDIYNSLPHPGMGTGVNTEQWAPFVNFDTINIVMTPVQHTYEMDDFALVDWNPFIIVDGNRDIEIHLKDKPPTSLADTFIFGTVEDDSDPGTDRYYVTAKNLPWAIDIPSSFDWPNEKIDISWVYLNFIEWAESMGTKKTTWYTDAPGNRNSSNIYQTPNP